MPKGIERRIRGRVVTRARNQHWSKNSVTGKVFRVPWRRASSATANMFPVSRTAVAIFPSSRPLPGDDLIGRPSAPTVAGPPLGEPNRRAISWRLSGSVCVETAGIDSVVSPGSVNDLPLPEAPESTLGEGFVPVLLPYRENGTVGATLR